MNLSIPLLACVLPLITSSLAAQGVEIAGEKLPREGRQESILKIYSIEEITAMLAGRGEKDKPESAERKKRLNQAGDQVVRIVRAFMPESDETKGIAIEQSGGSALAVSAPAKQQEWCEGFLRTWKSNLEPMIEVELRILSLPAAAAEDFHFGEKPTVIHRTEKELKKILKRFETAKDVTSIASPRLTCLNGQRASISITNQTSYVKRYDVHEVVEPGHHRIVDPVIDVVQDGLVTDILPVTVKEDTLGIDLKVTLSKLKRPMEVRKTEFGEVCVPEVSVMTVESTLLMEVGAVALFNTSEHDGQRMMLIVRARKVDPRQLEKGPQKKR